MKGRTAQDVVLQQLRNYYSRPHCQPLISRRHYGVYHPKFLFPEQTISRPSTDIGIFGGGITGLVSAYWLSKVNPNAKITLYEASSRLGGWLNTQRVRIPNHGEVLFEQGPRSLRPTIPNGALTILLIEKLGLADQILTTPKDAPAARNRFIYYPDHLVRMPHPKDGIFNIAQTIFTEQAFSGIFSAIWTDMISEDRPVGLQDESVGDFISRRFHPNVADNIVSAVLHGIYAGDVYSLSVKSLLPSLWEAEVYFNEWGPGSSYVALSLIEQRRKGPRVFKTDYQLMDMLRVGLLAQDTLPTAERKFAEDLKNCSVFTLRGGLGQLSDRLVQVLKASPNVSIRTDCYVQEIGLVPDPKPPDFKIQIKHKGKNNKVSSQRHDRAICTIGSSHIPTLTKDPNLAVLAQTPSVTVMVVNLYFGTPSLLPIRGFGYLLPRSVPFEQNPERALGVVFDSDATAGQDSAPGTKLTVMLGGHWWNGWSSYPSSDDGIAMARAVLERHLGITEAPLFAQATLQRDCIPQYTVGHEERMVRADKALRERWDGRLLVAGNSYAGVGVNDCVRAALDVALGVTVWGWKPGLEAFVYENAKAKHQLPPYGKLTW